MLEHSPDSLLNLCIYAFGDYVNSLTVEWIQEARDTNGTPERSCSDTMDGGFSGITHIQNVQRMFNDVSLPSLVINEVTMKLLRYLDKQFSWTIFTGPEDLVLNDVFDLLIHPAVTQLNFLEHGFWRVIGRHVDRSLPRLRMLKVLQVERILDCESLRYPHHNLQELTLSEGTNEILRCASEGCKNLRKIDVENSIRISGEGVIFLLRFKNLEQLNVRGTSLGRRSIAQLLKGLAKNKNSENVALLKSFGCNQLTCHDLQLLSDEFLGIVSLKVNQMKPEIRALQEMKNLNTLMIGKASFTFVKQLIEAVGHQLSHLQFSSVQAVDICLLAKSCPSLVSLQVITERDCDVPNTSELATLSNFKSLNLVDLTLMNCPNFLTGILSYCTNVKIFKVKGRGRLNVNFSEIFERNPLSQLEELYWWSFISLLPETAHKIIKHCKSLRVLRGNCCWYRYRCTRLCYDDCVDVCMDFPWSGRASMFVTPKFL